jgi:hypothetical protein
MQPTFNAWIITRELSLLALDDVLPRHMMPDRFHRDVRIRAIESLLFERLPNTRLQSSALAPAALRVHTPSMTLKNAALLAFVGTILVAALLVWNLIFSLVSVMRGLVPAVVLVPALIYAFAVLSVALFFYVFKKAQ